MREVDVERNCDMCFCLLVKEWKRTRGKQKCFKWMRTRREGGGITHETKHLKKSMHTEERNF